MKQLTRLDQIGWIFAAALGTVMLTSGFDGPTDKVGVVDIAKVLAKSDYYKANKDAFDKKKAVREEMLKFISENPLFTGDQMKEFKDRYLKDPRTKDDDAAIAKIEADVTDAVNKFKALQPKANRTKEEDNMVADYKNRNEMTSQLAQQWYQEFKNDLTSFDDEHNAEAFDKVKAAVSDVAKAQGFSLVFDARFCPYGSNDMTDAALTRMNEKK